jgi:hypothetical protein
MDLSFFTDPRFLVLLRFWEERRGDAAVPAWQEGTIAALPAEIAPYVIAAHCKGASGRYFFFGASCIERIGFDPSGQTLDEFLRGGMRRYVGDMARAAQESAAPIFSYCLYEVAGEAPMRTARVYAPFAPDVVLALQLFAPSRAPLSRYATSAKFEEIERKRILTGAEALRKLEQAARFRRLGRAVHVTQVADDLMAAARTFDAEATVPLPVLRDAAKDARDRP